MQTKYLCCSFDCSPQNSVQFKKAEIKGFKAPQQKWFLLVLHFSSDHHWILSIIQVDIIASQVPPDTHHAVQQKLWQLSKGSRRHVWDFSFHHPLQFVAQWQYKKPFLAITSFLSALSEWSCSAADGWLGLFLPRAACWHVRTKESKALQTDATDIVFSCLLFFFAVASSLTKC